MTKSGKHCGKRRNCTFCAISSFVTMFSESVYMRERVNQESFLVAVCTYAILSELRANNADAYASLNLHWSTLSDTVFNCSNAL